MTGNFKIVFKYNKISKVLYIDLNIKQYILDKYNLHRFILLTNKKIILQQVGSELPENNKFRILFSKLTPSNISENRLIVGATNNKYFIKDLNENQAKEWIKLITTMLKLFSVKILKNV